jgi:hypothetical protein
VLDLSVPGQAGQGDCGLEVALGILKASGVILLDTDGHSPDQLADTILAILEPDHA